jgi:hypothetical protein
VKPYTVAVRALCEFAAKQGTGVPLPEKAATQTADAAH